MIARARPSTSGRAFGATLRSGRTATLRLAFVAALVALCARSAAALEEDVFDDYKLVGTAEDSRKKAGPLTFSGLNMDPTLDWKLADIFTPHVFAGETGGYSDNILLNADGTGVRRDFFSRTEAGTRLDALFGTDHVFTADYRFIGWLYPKETDLDTLEQSARARLDLNFPSVTVHGDGGWARTSYSRSLLIRGLVRQDDYEGTGFVSTRLGSFTLGAGGGFDRVDFIHTHDLSQFDHKAYLASAQVGYAVYEKLSAIVAYQYEQFHYDRRVNNDYQVHGVLAGASGSLGPRLSLSAMFGADFQIVDQRSGTSTDRRSYRGFIAECAVAWHPTTTLELTLSYRRDLLWAPNGNFQTDDGVTLSASQIFFDDKLQAQISVALDHADPSQGANVDRFHPQARLTWRVFRWLHASASYQYTQTWSDDPNSRYDEHRVELTVGVGF